jgi:hypothetical protein
MPENDDTRSTRASNATEARRVTNAEIKRDLQRIEGRVYKTTTIVEKLEPIIPDLGRLAANVDTLLHLAKEEDDKSITWAVLRRWTRWDTGVRTFIKMLAGAVIVAVCTIVVYGLFHLAPLGSDTTPPHPTPTPLSTPIVIPVTLRP